MCSPVSNEIRVLLVDDDSAVLRSLKRVLQEHGIGVQTTSCAAEAEVILGRYEFDAIVCDQNMPGKTGLELLTETTMKFPDLVTMMLSGQISGIAVAKDWANEIGVHSVYEKPFDANVIAEDIVSAVSASAEGGCG